MCESDGYCVEILELGEGFYHPEEEDIVSVNVNWITENGVSTPRVDLSFELGEYDTQARQIIHSTIEMLKKNGKAKITFFDDTKLKEIQDWISGIELSCEMEIILVDWQTAKRPWQKNNEERLDYANHSRTQGNLCFKAQDMPMSIRRYSRAIKSLVPILTYENEDMKTRVMSAKVSCYMNLAMCQLRLGLWNYVTENASKALKIDNNNIKAFYRRAVAYVNLNEFQKAKTDLNIILATEPDNKAALEQFKRLEIKVKSHDKQVANVMKKYLEGGT